MDLITKQFGYCNANVRGELPKPPKHKTLLCVGMDDPESNVAAAKAFAEKNDCDVAVCNEAAEQYPGPINFLVSMHTHLLPGWLKGRKDKKAKTIVVGSKPVEGVDISIAADRPVGSSAMLMIMLAKAIGYERIVLVGVSLDGKHDDRFRAIWKAAKAQKMLEGVEALTGGWVAQLLAGRVK